MSSKLKNHFAVRQIGSNEPWWSPSRDISTVFPKIIRSVFYKLSDAMDDASENKISKLIELAEQLNVSPADIADIAQAYSLIVRGVSEKRDVTELIQQPEFVNNPAQAVIALLFMREMTQAFADLYGMTLTSKDVDPNFKTIDLLTNTLNKISKDLANRQTLRG